MSTTSGDIAGFQRNLFGSNKKFEEEIKREKREKEYRKDKLTGRGGVYKPERSNVIRRVVPGKNK
jgi:hypothetical protein